MKGIVYRLDVSASLLDALHDFKAPILEVYIPQEGIAVNLGMDG